MLVVIGNVVCIRVDYIAVSIVLAVSLTYYVCNIEVESRISYQYHTDNFSYNLSPFKRIENQENGAYKKRNAKDELQYPDTF